MGGKVSSKVSRLEKIVLAHEDRLNKLENTVDSINTQLQDMRTRMAKQDNHITEISTKVRDLWAFFKYFLAPAMISLLGLAIANLFV